MFRTETEETEMATITRTDIHRPTAIDPENYDYLDSYDMGTGVDASPEDRRAFHQDVKRLQAEGMRVADHVDASPWWTQCGTCGQQGLRYVALVMHPATDEFMAVGGTCIETTFQEARADLDVKQANAAQARKDAKKLAAFNELCVQYPALAEAAALVAKGYEMVEGTDLRWHEAHRKTWAVSTLSDIARKARQYGDLSNKQAALVERLVDELHAAEATTAEREEKYAAERATRVEAHIGEVGERREFTGKVVWCDDFVNDYDPYGGMRTIMVIQTAEGTIKWAASKVIDVERGNTISFTATVKAHEIHEKTESPTTVVNRPAKIKIT